jgi:hypothetical protein
MCLIIEVAASTDQILESPAMLHQLEDMLAEPRQNENQNSRSCGMLVGEAHRNAQVMWWWVEAEICRRLVGIMYDGPSTRTRKA